MHASAHVSTGIRHSTRADQKAVELMRYAKSLNVILGLVPEGERIVPLNILIMAETHPLVNIDNETAPIAELSKRFDRVFLKIGVDPYTFAPESARLA